MPEPSEAVVRGAWDAYRAGDMSALLALVHPDLEWTYLDPAFARPRAADLPRRGQLAQALKRGQVRALTWDIEELAAHGDQVMLVLHARGVDQQRVRQAGDRNYLVLTVWQGQIAAMGAYGDGAEASRSAGLGQPA
jgi:ketosteroid isomerase-like protein